MAYFRFFRRLHVAPGLTLNLVKSGPSVSLGVRGAHVTLGRSGIRRTVGVPGSGIFYTARDGWHSGAHTGQSFHESAGELHGLRRVAHDALVIFLALVVIVVALAILASVLSR
jgi:Protein of unknown function (DUF4236)